MKKQNNTKIVSMYWTTTWKYLYSYLYLSAENVEEEWRDLWDSNPNLDLITILTIHTHTRRWTERFSLYFLDAEAIKKSKPFPPTWWRRASMWFIFIFGRLLDSRLGEKSAFKVLHQIFFTIPPSPTSVLQHREILKGKQNKHNDSDMHRIQLRWIKISHK